MQGVVQDVEFIKAALALPGSLVIASLDHVDDMTVEVLWVPNGELKSLGLSEEVLVLLLLLLVNVGLLDGVRVGLFGGSCSGGGVLILLLRRGFYHIVFIFALNLKSY